MWNGLCFYSEAGPVRWDVFGQLLQIIVDPLWKRSGPRDWLDSVRWVLYSRLAASVYAHIRHKLHTVDLLNSSIFIAYAHACEPYL